MIQDTIIVNNKYRANDYSSSVDVLLLSALRRYRFIETESDFCERN